MQWLPRAFETEVRRLLRILLVRFRTLPTNANGKRGLLYAERRDRLSVPKDTTNNFGRARIADSAGAAGAIIAALCCAGTPFIVGGLAAMGLTFLRSDAILWPLMLISLAVALWGFWQGRAVHHRVGPLALGVMGAASLACGVIIVHGPPAMTMIYSGAVVLVGATVWNVRERRLLVRH